MTGPKRIRIHILFLTLLSVFVGKSTIRPTRHYLENHADVDWELVLRAILSPTRTHRNKRRGKDRFTYIRVGKEMIEVHVRIDPDGNVWVINAFRSR